MPTGTIRWYGAADWREAGAPAAGDACSRGRNEGGVPRLFGHAWPNAPLPLRRRAFRGRAASMTLSLWPSALSPVAASLTAYANLTPMAGRDPFERGGGCDAVHACGSAGPALNPDSRRTDLAAGRCFWPKCRCINAPGRSPGAASVGSDGIPRAIGRSSRPRRDRRSKRPSNPVRQRLPTKAGWSWRAGARPGHA